MTGAVIVPETDLSPSVSSFDPKDFVRITGREEAWRFTPMRRLGSLHLDYTVSGTVSYLAQTSETIEVREVSPDDPSLLSVPAPTDRVGAQAWASLDKVALVDVTGDGEAKVVVATTGTGPVSGHVHVFVPSGLQAKVLIEHVGTAAYAGGVTAYLEDAAHLTVSTVQRADPDSVTVVANQFDIGRNAVLRHNLVTLGGDVVRVTNRTNYRGPGGDAELVGVFFTGPGQHHEHRLFVDHSEPHCRSDVAYKGALAGKKAHSVWVGDVLIRAAAVGTNTYELNRNLVLSEGARADSVPNLEIETGEIAGAGHAAATGRFDEEQLFYLQSRGIPATVARRLVVRGFFADVARRIGQEVADDLLNFVDDRLTALEEVI